MGQIWDFLRRCQNEQKTDLKKSDICPIWCQSGLVRGQICHPCALSKPENCALQSCDKWDRRTAVSQSQRDKCDRRPALSQSEHGYVTFPAITPASPTSLITGFIESVWNSYLCHSASSLALSNLKLCFKTLFFVAFCLFYLCCFLFLVCLFCI